MTKIQLDNIKPILKKNGVTFAGIFGSQLGNRARPDSDVDILVRFRTPQGLIKTARLQRLLSQKLKRKVDLVTEGALSPYIKNEVLRKVRPIYEER